MGKAVKRIIVQYDDDSLEFPEECVLFNLLKDEKSVCHVFGKVDEREVESFASFLGIGKQEVVCLKERLRSLGIMQKYENFTHPMENSIKDGTCGQ